ncbi:MAG: hypothetical protein RL226_1138, partial [Bacteroidota bacterium]
HGVENLHVGMRVAGMTRFGGYAEYCVTKATGVVQVPEEMDVIDATALGTQACTAYYASHMATNLFSGERVLVHAGAGGVGLFLIQLAKRRGCEVFATVGSDAKEQVARDFGADHVVNYRKADYEEEMNQLLRGQRLDVVFNAIAGTTFKKDQRLLGSGGRNVIYGAAERTSMQGGKFATMQLIFRMGLLIPILRMAKSQSIIGVNMLKIADHRAERIQEALKACVDLMIAGDLRVHGEVFHVDALADAHERLEKRETSGKVVIRW